MTDTTAQPFTPAWLDDIAFNAKGLVPAIAQDHATGEILMMAWMNAEAIMLTAKTKTAVYYSRSRSKLWHKGETSGHVQIVHDIFLDCDGDCIILEVTQKGGIACHTGRKSCFYRRLETAQGGHGTQATHATWQTVMPVLKDPDAIYGQHDEQGQSGQTATTQETHADDFRADLEGSQTADTRFQANDVLAELDKVLAERKHAKADSSYVASLYDKGINKILEKVGEEAIETVIAGKDLAQVQHSLTSEAYASAKHELIYEIADVWFHTMVTLAWFNIGSDAILSELARRFGLSGIDEKNSR